MNLFQSGLAFAIICFVAVNGQTATPTISPPTYAPTESPTSLPTMIPTISPTIGPTTSEPTRSPTLIDLGTQHAGNLCNLSALNSSVYISNPAGNVRDELEHIFREEQYDAHVINGYGNGYNLPGHVCESIMHGYTAVAHGASCYVYITINSNSDIVVFNQSTDSTFRTLADRCFELCYTLFGLDDCAATTMFNQLAHVNDLHRQGISCTPVKTERNISCTDNFKFSEMEPYMATFTKNRVLTYAPTMTHPTRSPTYVTTKSPTFTLSPTTSPTFTKSPTAAPTPAPTADIYEVLQFYMVGSEANTTYNRCSSNDAQSPALATLRRNINERFCTKMYVEAASYLKIQDDLANHMPWVGSMCDATTVTTCAQNEDILDIGFEVDTVPADTYKINLLNRECTWNATHCVANATGGFAIGQCYPPNNNSELGPNTGQVFGVSNYTANYCYVSPGVFTECTGCANTKEYTLADIEVVWHKAVSSLLLETIATPITLSNGTVLRGSFSKPGKYTEPTTARATTTVAAGAAGNTGDDDDGLTTGEIIGIAAGSVAGVSVLGVVVVMMMRQGGNTGSGWKYIGGADESLIG